MLLFSIVIPTYNRAELIGKTIESVLDQSYTNFEIIIVNDASTDNTIEVLSRYNKFSNIRCITLDNNSERGACRNRGIKESKGDYIVFLDSDDLLYKQHLEVLLKHIKKLNKPNFIATFHDIGTLENHGLNPPFIGVQEGSYDYHFFLEGNPLASLFCIKAQNSALILFLEDQKYSIMEDWIFLIENLMNDKIQLIDEITLLLVDHSGRSMRSDGLRVIQRRLNALGYIKSKVALPKDEMNFLESSSYYFCSVHNYLADNGRYDSIKFLIKSLWIGGTWLKLKPYRHLIRITLGKKWYGFLTGRRLK